jgi:hypothetical protein
MAEWLSVDCWTVSGLVRPAFNGMCVAATNWKVHGQCPNIDTLGSTFLAGIQEGLQRGAIQERLKIPGLWGSPNPVRSRE